MNFWPFTLFSRKAASAYDLLRELVNARPSASGKVVNTATALEVSTVFACLRVLGEGVAQVPLKLMRVTADGRTRTEAREHPLYDLLACRPNAWQTSFEFRETLVMHAALAGNAYSFVNRGARRRVIELVPLVPSAVQPERADDNTLTYRVTAFNGATQVFPAEAIWHVKGPSWNSWQGLESVKLAREAIGLSMSIEESQAKLQRNGARVSGTYSVEGPLSPEQYKSLKQWLDTEGTSGGALVLDRGAKWLNTTMNGVDAQTLETRKLQVEEVCRFFRVNPIMVGAESKNTTYASAEQMFLAHLVHTLAPWYTRLEQSIDANLLTDAERASGLYANFVEEGLLRGSAEATMTTILGYVNGGLMTPNEGRAKLDLNPDDDEASDELRIPANLVGAIPAEPPEAADPAEDAPDTPSEEPA